MSELKRCTKCVLTETHETIQFDQEGVCNICKQQDIKKKMNWEAKKKELDTLIQETRGRAGYDCIVPFSGGKNSTWTLYYLIKEYDLKPLVIRFNHGFIRPICARDTIRTMRRLGVDFMDFHPDWHVVQKLMLLSFIEKGDFCWHCHTGVFSFPMQMAIKYKVPLVVWGEPSSEYSAYYTHGQSEEVDEKRFKAVVDLGLSIDHIKDKLGDIDLRPFTYPAIEEMRKINLRSVCLGSYIPWDTKIQSETIMKELGWVGDTVEGVPPVYNYEKIECYMQGMRDYLIYIKKGFGRTTHLAAIDIRNERITREDGMKMIEEFENKRPQSLKLFLGYLGVSFREFREIASKHCVKPYRHDFMKEGRGDMTHDFYRWPKFRKMPRNEAVAIMEKCGVK